MTNKKIVFFFLLPVLLSFILHFYVFKLDLMGYHVWRQSQTQTVIYNFTFSDNNIFHPQKFDLTGGSTQLLYEFPLYQWLVAQINHVLGYSVAHTRLFTFLVFIFMLLGFYRLLIKFVSNEIALVSNALLCFSPLLYYYCVNPLPDLLALCFAVWSLNFFFGFIISRKNIDFFWFSFSLMLAALVKLPFMIFGSVFMVYAFRSWRKRKFTMIITRTLTLSVFLIPVVSWYALAIPTWRDKGIVSGLPANHKTILHLLDCFQFNLISSVPELLTNYASCAFLIAGIYLFFKKFTILKKTSAYFIVLFLTASFYFVYELNMIEKAHDYYLMPFIPLIFLVVSYGLKHFYLSKYRKWVFVITCIVPLTAWLRIDPRWNPSTPGFVTDYLTNQKTLQAIIPKDARCIIDYDDSHFISLYYLKRQGYSLFEKELSPLLLKERYTQGAVFFVTENLSINLSDYKDFDFEELYSKNLKVYKLSLK